MLQHAHNPVDWYPWGEEALRKAHNEQKLILVSIGYATCHWCHVMERESFENEEIAQILNQHYVAIKVDREERPDVDKIYMNALHAIHQQGGWPLNMFLTPEGKPITGGTYFPPIEKYGRPSFGTILLNLVHYWKQEQEKVYDQANTLTEHLQEQAKSLMNRTQETSFSWTAEQNTIEFFQQSFDPQDGGFQFQKQNKFPPSIGLMFLLRAFERTGEPQILHMVELTLKKMITGGIYDQIGGGLSRYSTDYQWMVPHFEKMLYDNALFALALLETYQVTKNLLYAEVIEHTFSYIRREMISQEGAFFSAEDADSEGVEGKFYVWRPQEIIAVLGDVVGKQACEMWGITEQGNFEGNSIPYQAKSLSSLGKAWKMNLKEVKDLRSNMRKQLLAARSKRIHPLCDDKILTSWNALMIIAFARAGRVLDQEEYIQIAQTAARFILENVVNEEGTLLRRYREGEARYHGYLSDYAQFAMACLELYEATYDLDWFQQAVHWAEQINRLFHNSKGPYFDTSIDAEELLTRNMEGYDGVEPSGNSTTALLFFKLSSYGLEGTYREDAERILTAFYPYLQKAGVSFGAMHWAHHYHLSLPKEIVIVGNPNHSDTQSLLEIVRKQYLPNIVVALSPLEDADKIQRELPITQNKIMLRGQATAYVCRNQTCDLPIHTPEDLMKQLKN